jgi:hypothetical protein
MLARVGLRLNPDKTSIRDIRSDVGFDFLGFHHHMVASRKQPGGRFLARWPSDRAMNSIRSRLRDITDRRHVGVDLAVNVGRMNAARHCACHLMNGVGKPCAGEPHARFDKGPLAKRTGCRRHADDAEKPEGPGLVLDRHADQPAAYLTLTSRATSVRYFEKGTERPMVRSGLFADPTFGYLEPVSDQYVIELSDRASSRPSAASDRGSIRMGQVHGWAKHVEIAGNHGWELRPSEMADESTQLARPVRDAMRQVSVDYADHTEVIKLEFNNLRGPFLHVAIGKAEREVAVSNDGETAQHRESASTDFVGNGVGDHTQVVQSRVSENVQFDAVWVTAFQRRCERGARSASWPPILLHDNDIGGE